MARPKQVTKVSDLRNDSDERPFLCVRCGLEHPSPVGRFLRSPSELWASNDGYCPVCKTCLDELYYSFRDSLSSETQAMMAICHYMDIPFEYDVFESAVVNSRDRFTVGAYTKLLYNTNKIKGKTFVNTLLEGKNIITGSQTITEKLESEWSQSELRNRDSVIKALGGDPFEGCSDEDRRYLFSDLVKYLDDDLIEDTYMVSQIIQVVHNNNQIRECNRIISNMNPALQADEIATLNTLKKSLVDANDKIAKENEISVRNRSNKEAGRSTLTYLMKDLREKNFERAEMDYYDQLKTPAMDWILDMSMASIKRNSFFDENDMREILETQRAKLLELQSKVDSLTEENRIALLENAQLKAKVKAHGS